jgi:hypothetical protein
VLLNTKVVCTGFEVEFSPIPSGRQEAGRSNAQPGRDAMLDRPSKLTGSAYFGERHQSRLVRDRGLFMAGTFG